MKLKDFLQSELDKPYEWGVTDCASTANRWVIAATGIDPMSKRKHENYAQARAWINDKRTLYHAVCEVMSESGFEITHDPKAGDIGIIIHDNNICVSIFTGDAWVSRSEDGIIITKADKFKAWSING